MNLFAVSYYAPPQLTPQAIQVARLLYHLEARVTLLHGRDLQCSDGYRQYPDFFERVAVLPVHDPGPRLAALAQRAAARWLPLYQTCPYRFGRWRARALGPALSSIAAERPDALVSFGMPMSGHLLALALKRRTGLPWLAHVSDPWSDNPFHQTSWLEHQVNLAPERRVVQGADALLFTSRRTRELVMRKYPAARLGAPGVLPHAWDMAQVAAAAPPRGARHTVRHIGACYGSRSPGPLFEALQRIVARSPRALDGVAFELVGPLAPAFRSAAALDLSVCSLRRRPCWRRASARGATSTRRWCAAPARCISATAATTSSPSSTKNLPTPTARASSTRPTGAGWCAIKPAVPPANRSSTALACVPSPTCGPQLS